MLDFTSSLYLGFDHESTTLRPWKQLTAGKPAALQTMPGTRSAASDLAVLAGFEAATLAPSTLHAFWDVFGLWPARRCAIYVDGAAYAIGRWGAERAAARGATLRGFRHHDAEALDAALREGPRGSVPVVVADGFCPCCGSPAPLPEYMECVQRYEGYLVLDDTQALGVLGEAPSRRLPLGRGGGGTMRWFGVKDPRVVLVASLAKGFGAPVAVVAAAREMVERYERTAETRMHCSPVSAPALHAAENALAVNAHKENGSGGRQFSRLSPLQVQAGDPKRFEDLAVSGGDLLRDKPVPAPCGHPSLPPTLCPRPFISNTDPTEFQ